MPRAVFSDDLEKTLIELWRETSSSVDVDDVLLLREAWRMNSTIQARYNCFYFSHELKISNKLIKRKKIEGTQPRDLQNYHMTIMFLHGNLLTKMFQVVTGVQCAWKGFFKYFCLVLNATFASNFQVV